MAYIYIYTYTDPSLNRRRTDHEQIMEFGSTDSLSRKRFDLEILNDLISQVFPEVNIDFNRTLMEYRKKWLFLEVQQFKWAEHQEESPAKPIPTMCEPEQAESEPAKTVIYISSDEEYSTDEYGTDAQGKRSKNISENQFRTSNSNEVDLTSRSVNDSQDTPKSEKTVIYIPSDGEAEVAPKAKGTEIGKFVSRRPAKLLVPDIAVKDAIEQLIVALQKSNPKFLSPRVRRQIRLRIRRSVSARRINGKKNANIADLESLYTELLHLVPARLRKKTKSLIAKNCKNKKTPHQLKDSRMRQLKKANE